MKSGILYPQGRRKHAEVSITEIVKQLKKAAWRLRLLGAGLLLFSVIGLVWIFTPLLSAEISYSFRSHAEDRPSKFGNLVNDWPNWDVPNQDYSLYIPKINAKSMVVPGVNAGDEKAYLQALKLGVAAAQGMANPGELGTTYMFAHSTNSPLNYARYNAVFYLLDKINVGDRIEVVYNYNGKLYRYQAAGREILDPTDVHYLTPQKQEEKLILQTCYPPGTTWKRLVIVAKRV
jgi:LPXTG-site transpeptidase (sortase) family protein